MVRETALLWLHLALAHEVLDDCPPTPGTQGPPRLALALQAFSQKHLKQRLIRNVAPVREYFEILDHGDRKTQ